MTTRDVVFVVAHEHQDRAAAFCQKHRHFTTTEAMDDLAAEFEKVARQARAQALRDAAEWVHDVDRSESDHQRANAAFHCVSIIQIRSKDRP